MLSGKRLDVLGQCKVTVIIITVDGWKYIFLSEIYRPIFQARNFFLHYAWEDFFFPNFFLGIIFFWFCPLPPPPITFLMVRPLYFFT